VKDKYRKPYGIELIKDLHGCDISTFNRASLDGFLRSFAKQLA